MKQVEVYKEALRIMEKARATYNFRSGYTYWLVESYFFGGLCRLIDDLSLSSDEVTARFKRDSEKLLGRELDGDDLWFTTIETDEPKARAERLEHLQNLIKLYEDETNRDI